MKKLCVFATVFASWLCFVCSPTYSATMEDIQASIEAGLAWLVPLQHVDGHYGDYEPIATTALVVMKLEERAFELGYDGPFDPAYPYKANVEAGLDYLFNQAQASGPTGILFANPWPPGHHSTYNTGVAMMAVAGSAEPSRVVGVGLFAGLTYLDFVQRCVNHFDSTQRPDGGWRYIPTDLYSDNSNTGFAVLGLRYAEEFGCTIDPTLKTDLSSYLDLVQDDVGAGDPLYDGCSWYVAPGSGIYTSRWANTLKAGNLLFEMAFVGDTCTTPRVMDAIDFIERYWNMLFDEFGRPEWRTNALSMYCLMKGFVAINVDVIEVSGSPVDWFDTFADIILAAQHPDGYWPPVSLAWLDPYLGVPPVQTTIFNLLTLEKIAPTFLTIEKDYRHTDVCFERDNDLDGLFNEDPADDDGDGLINEDPVGDVDLDGDPDDDGDGLIDEDTGTISDDNDGDGFVDEDSIDCPDGTYTGYLLDQDLAGNFLLHAVQHKNGKILNYVPGQYYAVTTVEVPADVDTLCISEQFGDCTGIGELNPKPGRGGGSVVIVYVDEDGVAWQIADANPGAGVVTFDEVDGEVVGATACLEDVKAGIYLMYVKFGPALKGEMVDLPVCCENTTTAIIDPDGFEIRPDVETCAYLCLVPVPD